VGLFGKLRSKSRSESLATGFVPPPYEGAGQRGAVLPRQVPQLTRAQADPLAIGGGGFVIVDVETTGLSPRTDRVLELAVIRTDSAGQPVSEWVSRFFPDRKVAATRIHGITDADVADAPRFGTLLPHITGLLTGAAVVAHNATFDLAFLRAEYARAGWALPRVPSVCTLEASSIFEPGLDRRRLADCCAAAGIRHSQQHSALADARAVRELLASWVSRHKGTPPGPPFAAAVQQAAAVVWPVGPGGVRAPEALPVWQERALTRLETPSLVSLLDRFALADAIDEGAPDGTMPYLQLLGDVLEDGVLTVEEQEALHDLAAHYDLHPDDLDAVHKGFVLALAHLALDDGKVTRAERDELLLAADLLHLPSAVVTDVLQAAEQARLERLSLGLRALPADWTLGEPLRVGDKVAFTGCDEALRARLERRAEKLGVRVMTNVSKRTALLVTDETCHGTKSSAADTHRTRRVSPEDFTLLLRHLQPAHFTPGSASARSDVVGAVLPEPRGAALQEVTTTSTAERRLPTGEIRAWARANGYTVGDRGRLPAEVLAAWSVATVRA
jgi:DNA polymerase-3 subunit epsilon